MLKLCFILLLIQIGIDAFYLPAVKNTAEEIQHAICHITTKELEAKANATITRQLKGVCTSVSDELNSKFEKLEQTLANLLELLEEKISASPINAVSGYRSANNDIGTVYEANNEISIDDTNNVCSNVHLRNEEILNANDTVIESKQGDLYFYYWNIENIQELLMKRDVYKSSPNFVILGHPLQLRFYPNYPEENNFAVQLKPLSKGFIKTHQIFILNECNSELDIDSGNLFASTNDEIKFQFVSSDIKAPGYIHSNIMIIAVKIYLDS